MYKMLPVLCTFLLLNYNCSSYKDASLILFNGKVITVNNDFEITEAVVCKDDKIIFTGSTNAALQYQSSDTKLINLSGKVVLPGLTDSQGHMLELGSQLTYLNISNAKSYSEIIELVKERIAQCKPGEWILGGRWDENNWTNKKFPNHKLLSEVSPDNPVFLDRVDGYAALTNKKAMEIAGITKKTKQPFGGNIIFDKNHEPTGVLINRAKNLVKNLIPGETDSSYKVKMLKAIDNCKKVGLTTWHEIGASPYEVSLLKDLINENKIEMRTVVFLGKKEDPVIEEDLEKYFSKHRIENYGNHHLAVTGIQLYLDGSVGSRGAAMYKPYLDDPDNIGLLRIPPGYVYEAAISGLKLKMIVNTSCIGTRGNHICLEKYREAFDEFGFRDHRFRITHAQILLPEDIDRFSQLNIIPSMQPVHATSDKRFVEKRLGKERMKGAYAWRSLLDSGSKIICGSDFPVESNNPFIGMYAAVTRTDSDGYPPGGWYPEQCMTIEEVIKGYTIWPAYSVFQDDILGSIETGKLADFTVIDRDLLSIAPKDILDTKVIYTIVGGKIIYSPSETN